MLLTPRIVKRPVFLDHRKVRSGPVQVPQSVRVKPRDGRMFMQGNGPLTDGTYEGIERYGEGWINVRRRRERPVDVDGDTEFLEHLAPETCLRVFALLDLPAGEFPLQREAHYGASLRRKDLSVVLDDRAGHMHVLSQTCGHPFTSP